MEEQPTTSVSSTNELQKNPFYHYFAAPFWKEDLKEEKCVEFDVVTDTTVVYKKKVVPVMPHLALKPGQKRLCGVPIPTLNTTMHVDTRLLLAEMQSIVHFASWSEEQAQRKRKIEAISSQSDVEGCETKPLEEPSEPNLEMLARKRSKALPTDAEGARVFLSS